MAIIYFLLILAACDITAAKSVQTLEIINWMGINNEVESDDVGTLRVRWNRVESGDEADPVVGYKIHVWGVKKVKKFKHVHYSNGSVEYVQVEEYPRAKRVNDTNVIPEGKLTVLEAPADSPTFSMKVKLEVPYQFTITAYTKNVVGPPSAITGTTLHGPDWVPKDWD